jgi:hypothetical protein
MAGLARPGLAKRPINEKPLLTTLTVNSMETDISQQIRFRFLTKLSVRSGPLGQIELFRPVRTAVVS